MKRAILLSGLILISTVVFAQKTTAAKSADPDTITLRIHKNDLALLKRVFVGYAIAISRSPDMTALQADENKKKLDTIYMKIFPEIKPKH